MRHPLTNEPVGIQRIALRHQNGRIQKIDRRMLGSNGVVKIWPAATELVVGEGLETVDHDAAGLMASDACTARWRDAGRIVVALTPEPKGGDFNDLIPEQ